MDSADFWLEDLIVSPDAREDPSCATTPPVLRAQGLELELLPAGNGAPSPPAVTSRISVQKFCATVARFDGFKTRLATETGLGGMLRLKPLPKLNLKFSAFLMERVNVDDRSIRIDDETSIKFSPQDVRNVFGLPCGARTLSSKPVRLSEACKEFRRAAAEIGGKGTHSLKAVEAILLKELTEASSTQVKIDCFKIAYVVFAVGHVLCPSSKYDYTSIDYWQALCNISSIAEFNWCEYVLGHLMPAVEKLKADMERGYSPIHLSGCHLFLQIFVLDNMDLGAVTLRQHASPRISLFDCATLRKMIGILTTGVTGDKSFFLARGLRRDDVGYTVSNAGHIARAGAHNEQHPFVSSHQEQTPDPEQYPSSAEEFTEHLRRLYPEMDAEAVCTLLRECNARMCAHMDEMEQKCQAERLDFADKLLKLVSKSRCTCKPSTN
ncbi:uncharacterized protein LOC119326393 isoform X2 [Triticum dicoccoides]|uniref:uncharacterized protein LOC119326393 isoform X2 n=1 Tax=Triticum dicoccoides TaxID=85692 RepID=UPI0018916AE5|nr:uncharacterized protein LOC119326393 isoform X2 [Triticum dicoccoides]